MANNKYEVQYAKSGRSTCKDTQCKKGIEKGSLRIGKLTPNPFGDENDTMPTWYHPKCMFNTLKRARATTKKIESEEDLIGFDDLEAKDQGFILGLLAGSNGGGATIGKKLKKGDDTSQLEIKNTKNTFYNFQQLCGKLGEYGGFLDKIAIMKANLKFFKKDRKLALLMFKLILPKQDKRVYGLKDKQMVKVFSALFGEDADDLQQHLNQSGDVSLTVKEFFMKGKRYKPRKMTEMTLKEVDELLDELTKTSGVGQKQALLGSTLARCSANDIMFICRFIKKDLKNNVGFKHLLKGLHENAPESFLHSQDLNKIVNHYLDKMEGKIPDTKDDTSGDLPGLAKMGKQHSVGMSVMTAVKPMLAAACKSYDACVKKCPNGFFAEIKYDGERIQIHKNSGVFKYYSRSLKEVAPRKVKEVEKFIPLAFPDGDNLVADGEILMVDSNTGLPLPFGTLGSHKKNDFKNAQVCLFIFDFLYYNGECLMQLPMSKRRSLLEKHMTVVPNRVMMSQKWEFSTASELGELMDDVMADKLEGLVMKCMNGKYEPGKRHWLKMKKDYLADGAMADTADLVVLGAYYGHGAMGGLLSTLLMGVQDGDCWRTVCKVGNGLDVKQVNDLQAELKPHMININRNSSKVPSWLIIDNKHLPDYVVKTPLKCPVYEITGAEFSQSHHHTAGGISIRFPRITRRRKDKGAAQATSFQELKDLYEASNRQQAPKAGKTTNKKPNKIARIGEIEYGSKASTSSSSTSSSTSTPSRKRPRAKTPAKEPTLAPAGSLDLVNSIRYGTKVYKNEKKEMPKVKLSKKLAEPRPKRPESGEPPKKKKKMSLKEELERIGDEDVYSNSSSESTTPGHTPSENEKSEVTSQKSPLKKKMKKPKKKAQSSSGGKFASLKWNCDVCSFENTGDNVLCIICGSSAPDSVMHARNDIAMNDEDADTEDNEESESEIEMLNTASTVPDFQQQVASQKQNQIKNTTEPQIEEAMDVDVPTSPASPAQKEEDMHTFKDDLKMMKKDTIDRESSSDDDEETKALKKQQKQKQMQQKQQHKMVKQDTIDGEESSDDEDEQEMKDGKPVCPYGAGCYRQNPQHKEDFYHPPAVAIATGLSDDQKARKKKKDDERIGKIHCQYGRNCYRKNPDHFKNEWHSDSEDDEFARALLDKDDVPDMTNVVRGKRKRNLLFDNMADFGDFSDSERSEEDEEEDSDMDGFIV
eukprot:TRINITY_DN4580_c0_g1_i1.p1 TRINITY_DN4580_c0_g1~~TRINITY_DN4580_c0_g1_i1.p1  ORF type:complete len:1207 (-),score=475.35 TRINITY_DN4580_c0_g1_i1:263-3883(-)